MPSETVYIAGIAVFTVGLLCIFSGATVLGLVGTLAGGLLWALAWRSRNAELRNYRAYYGAEPRYR
jgi:hypothetical protein